MEMELSTQSALPTAQTRFLSLESKRPAQTLFSPTFEQINLILPLVFILITAIDLNQNWTWTAQHKLVANFVSSSFFLNNIHAYFTFAFLFFIPEFRHWLDLSTTARRLFWLTPCFVLMAVCAMFCFVFWTKIPPALSKSIVLISILIPVHHGVQQTRGLSLLYNKKALRPDPPSTTVAQLNLADRWERRFFTAFLLFYCLYLTDRVLGFSQGFSAGQLLSFTSTSLFFSYSTCIAILIYKAFKFRAHYGFNKAIFLLRLILFALVPFSFFATFALAAIHGIEYLGVFNLVSQNSQITANQRRRFNWGTLAITLIGLLLLLPRPRDGIISLFVRPYNQVSPWLQFLAALSLGFTYLHYYFDRIIFKMSREESRQAILPLVVGRGKT